MTHNSTRGKRKTAWITLAILVVLDGIGVVQAFMCYTGDAEVLRRKTCPNFSDICFKKIPGPLEKKGETQRGCFNTEIATMITGSGANGCHSIPDTIGSGRICLCDTELCNSSQGLSVGGLYYVSAMFFTMLNVLI